MTSPYTPPSTTAEISSNSNSRKIALPGVILLAVPLLGAIGSIIGLIRAFSVLQTGNADPSKLASEISIALVSTAYSIPFGLIGVILVSVALFRSSNREVWFLRSVCILSILWCLLLFPIGLVFGIYLLIIFLMRKSEFTNQIKMQNKAQ